MGRNLNISAYKKTFLIFLRCLIILFICLSLSGLTVKDTVDKTTTIFTVDLSDSAKVSVKKVEEFIKKAITHKGKKDEVGIVVFGANAGVEAPPLLEPNFVEFESVINPRYTNISQGIKLSSTLIPEESKKRIVLISDGQENMENALSQAKILAEKNIKIDVLPIENTSTREVQVTEIIIPKYLRKNQEFDILVSVDSLVDTGGMLKIYDGKDLIQSQNVKVRKGQNRFVFLGMAKEGGARIYHAELEPEIDTIAENNSAFGYTYIEDIPHVLLVEKNNSGAEIREILKNSLIEVKSIEPHNVPIEADTLSKYDGVIIANIKADDLDERFLNNLESYIKHIGGGLIVTGGEDAYALGNYFDTPLETILPVNMELKDKRNIPDMGLMIVTDRSGSMEEARYGISKLELAKEAAIRAVEVLNPFDKVGVLSFDDQPQEIVRLQNVEKNLEKIQEDIASISSGGGTSIIPALRKAYEIIYNADTKIKHIILLTDGQAEKTGYDDLISKMAENNITLSTVAVGPSSDITLLRRLAQDGRGRYYYTDEFSDLPKIFIEETMTAGKTYLNDEEFYPIVTRLSPILEGVETLPKLQGYVATTPKNRAEVILSSPKEDPILSTWRYGLGKTVAWTSDVDNQWSLDWLASDSGIQVIRNMVSWVLRKPISENIVAEGRLVGENIEVTAKIPNIQSDAEVTVNIYGPDMEEKILDLKATAPGSYTGSFKGNNIGVYMLNFQINRFGETETIYTGMNIPYSSEYDINKMKKETVLLDQIARLTGGRVLKEAKDVFAEIQMDVYGERDIDGFLILLGLLLLIFDIAFRRISFISNKIEELIIKITDGLKLSGRIKVEGGKQKDKKQKVKKDKKDKVDRKISKKDNGKVSSTSAALLNQKRKRKR